MVLFAGVAVLFASVWLVRRELRHCLAEPVLARPVVVFESDDWGPGGAEHVEALHRLRALLRAYADRAGRHPCFALGVVLAIPEPAPADPATPYRRLDLGDERMAALREALAQGVADGTFSLSLHGMEHYWPASLLAVAARNREVNDWLTGPTYALSEHLPSPLQSRWVDASMLPSRPHAPAVVRAAAAEEAARFAEVFAVPPEVYVPATFVWNDDVEAALGATGIKALVTPGRRHVGRAADGTLVSDGRRYRNGERLPAGPIALVRDIYFEPAYGHSADTALARILDHARRGRPALVETHRCNFIGGEARRAASLAALAHLLDGIAATLPDVCFVSSATLAQTYREPGRAPVPLQAAPLARARAIGRRLWGVRRVRKVAAGAGAALAALLGIAVLQVAT